MMHRGMGLHKRHYFDDLQIGDTFEDIDQGMLIYNGTTWQSNDPTILKTPVVGDLVHYVPFEGCGVPLIENGRIKSIGESHLHVFVVYHCNDEWDDYLNYTGASTHIMQLRNGWINKQTEEKFYD